jgi:hypothetical protein
MALNNISPESIPLCKAIRDIGLNFAAKETKKAGQERSSG